MGLALRFAQGALFAAPPFGTGRIGALATLVAIGMVVYSIVALAIGAGDMRSLTGTAKRGKALHQAQNTSRSSLQRVD